MQEIRIPNSEFRRPKLNFTGRNLNSEDAETRRRTVFSINVGTSLFADVPLVALSARHSESSFRISDFGLLSDFGFRISDLIDLSRFRLSDGRGPS